jgi:hypothetical protein
LRSAGGDGIGASEHCAVIVAEDITSHFLNVIKLFNRSIPLIAIKLSAIRVGDEIGLVFTTVLDEVPRGAPDDEPPQETKDRPYWENKGSLVAPRPGPLALQVEDQVKVGGEHPVGAGADGEDGAEFGQFLDDPALAVIEGLVGQPIGARGENVRDRRDLSQTRKVEASGEAARS